MFFTLPSLSEGENMTRREKTPDARKNPLLDHQPSVLHEFSLNNIETKDKGDEVQIETGGNRLNDRVEDDFLELTRDRDANSRRATGFYQSDRQDVSKVFMAGYQLQLSAGLGIVCQVIQNMGAKIENADCKVLIFGMAGTGKSLYPEALMKHIYKNKGVQEFLQEVKLGNRNMRTDISLFHIPCLEVIKKHKDLISLSAFLDKLEQQIARNLPAIVFLDELDAFCSERLEQSTYTNHWTMNFMKENHDGLAVFGIANHPVVLDQAVLRQFKYMFYFELPDENTVKDVLAHYKIPYSEEVARKLCTDPVDTGELINGCEDVIRFKGNGDRRNLKRINAEELADFIGDYLKMPWKKVVNYESANDFYIRKARDHLAFWNTRKRILIGS